MADEYNVEADLDLVRRSRRGDKDAFAELFRRYYRMVAGIGYRYTGDISSAEDVAQETFLKVWRYLADFEPRSAHSLRAWVARIAHTSAIDAVRKRKTSVDLDDGQDAQGDLSVEEEVEAMERAKDVQEAIMRLPEKSREVLVLREYGGLSYAEISEALGIPMGTVMSRLNYARKSLKRELKEYLDDV
jgi:RNA polymerase sigma-70 factor (ECF subfamily)